MSSTDSDTAETAGKASSGNSAAAAAETPPSISSSISPSDTQQQSSSRQSTSSDNDKTGGLNLFDYLISRKKLHNNEVSPIPLSPDKNHQQQQHEERMKYQYHRLANAAALSIPLFQDDNNNISDIDTYRYSDNDDNTSNRNQSTKFAPSSSLSSYDTSSWMNKAWQTTVDSATDWMMMSSKSSKLGVPPLNNNSDMNIDRSTINNSSSSSSSNHSSSSSSWSLLLSLSSTVSNAISSININIHLPNGKVKYNPFKDDTESINRTSSSNDKYHNIHDSDSVLNNNNQNANNNNLLLLPKIASRFEWATKRRNPYQAVIGRVDTDYYLLLGQTAGTENRNGVGMVMRRRKKSLPSEASVMAVKNLLVLVQQQQQHYNDECNGGDQVQHQVEQQERPSQLQPRPKPSPLLTPIHSQSVETFTPRSPSIQPFPDFPELPEDSSSFESDHSVMNHYPSPRMTPVQPFHQASPKQHPHHHPSGNDGGSAVAKPVPSPLTLPKSSSSPLQDSTQSIHLCGKTITNAPNNIHGNDNNSNNQAADAEMAARLTEGTLRAYRDLALDEATELHSALHHWTLRWERPFLGWLEAGPTVWFSEKGYSPYSAGKKVSQIQAVLARRCAVIGEIQQHLWRANWQRGVAKWGMLGHGQGEWAAVMLEHGDMTTDVGGGGAAPPGPSPQNTTTNRKGTTKKKKQISMKIFNHSSFVGGNVSNSRGGQIMVDGDALTRWSIDGIKVVRDQLYRAGLAGAQLPYYENWPNEVRHFNGDTVGISDAEIDHPSWAKKDVAEANDNGYAAPTSIVINDLPGMADEVSSLLQSIELNLDQQRQRRLNKLRPPSNFRRNWYMFALGIPTAVYATYHVCKDHGGYFLLKEVLAKINEFCKEHISEPCFSIYQELFTRTGRIDVNDRKARIDTIESLKRMIRSWLDETFADMPEAEKIAMSNNMDISLIEELKEESIKHIYEINSVVRCSLIEMQFIKKELLNALVAMDELMGSNEINARLAAMTPAVILVVGIRKVFRFVFYALFKSGAPKQEIYASFRRTILDIERLLLMRDDPPPNPPSLSWGSTQIARSDIEADDAETNQKSRQTLTAADLGMLLLHIHECRTILWENRRRFDSDVLRNVSEDLAEIAGERGPVSVRQQLQILSRMSRTYKFMKVDYRTMIG